MNIKIELNRLLHKTYIKHLNLLLINDNLILIYFY